MYSATAHSVLRILAAIILLTLAATAATTTAFAGASGIMFGFSDDPDPGNARPDEPPYSMSNTDTVTHTGAVGDGFWINVHNEERQLIDTKILTIMFRGEGREKIKPVKVVGYDAAGTEGDTAEGEDIEGDNGVTTAIYTCELSPQPDYEKIEFEFVEAGTVNIVIRVNSFCGEFEGSGDFYHMDNVAYGREGYMYGNPALTELYIFPATRSIGTTAPPVLVAPPGSGVWWHELVYEDPEGNPREQGGIRWYTSGAGIAVGEFFDLAINMDGPADDRYTFYSYDAEVDE